MTSRSGSTLRRPASTSSLRYPEWIGPTHRAIDLSEFLEENLYQAVPQQDCLFSALRIAATPPASFTCAGGAGARILDRIEAASPILFAVR
jgi:hypothetical protein